MTPVLLPVFRAVCERTPYQPKGIFFSELFLFLRACDAAFVDQVIESGVKHGMSTRVLAAVYGGHVISIDQRFPRAFQAPAGVRLVRGDARVELPRLLAAARGRVAVLIDGPKGRKALVLKDACLAYPGVHLVGIHDLPRGYGEQAHSHDPTFRTYYGRDLDRLMPAAMTAKYPDGPGLGIWKRP